MILVRSVYDNERQYVLSDDQLSSLLGQQLSNLLHLTGSDIAESDQDDLAELVEEGETSFDDNLLFVSRLH